MKKSKLVISLLLTLAVTGGILWLVIPKPVELNPVTAEEAAWAKAFLRGTLRDSSVFYMDFLGERAGHVTPEYTVAAPPVDGRTQLDGGESVDYRVNVPNAGLYGLVLDCAARDRSFNNITLTVTVNGELQYAEANNIEIPLYWRDVTKDFPLDSFGDETVPSVEYINVPRPMGLYNTTYITARPILFWLDAGDNVINITNKSARVLFIGEMTVTADRPLPTYAEYRSRQSGSVVPGVKAINGTMYDEKNSIFVQLFSTNDIAAEPSDPVKRMVNIVDLAGAGTEADYKIYADTAGYYALTLHATVGSEDYSTFCTVRVNGEIPFEEAAGFAMSSGRRRGWANILFGDADGNPYYFWLDAGENTLSLRVDTEPISQQLRDLRLLIEHINQFSLDVKKIAGREVDKNRTWRLTRYMPETEDTLNAYDIMLRDLLTTLGQYSERGVDSSILSGLVESIGLMQIINEEPDELPLNIELLSSDRVSVLTSCGNALDDLMSNWFSLDQIYLFDGTSELPRERPFWTEQLSSMATQLWASFVSPKYAVRNDPEAINIWINANVMLADTLQKLADSRFTPETGIKVKFSIMPDQNKLVLAAAAGTQPDIAMAIERHIPFDLAVRGALHDLTEFDDFWQIADRFAPGSLIPYVFNDGIYGLSESLDFMTLVYREDILNSLGVPPPDTWRDVQEMMSELQRFDMSFYMPIASGIGYKWFHQTAPLIYQHNGLFYQEDGLGTAINQPNAVKGISFLGELFTTYALSEQVPSFFNAFRYGQTPVGIAGNADYLLIKYGAPELTGQWKLALPPGIEQEDGTISRWYVANGRGAIIFSDSDKLNESWEFLKWWTSEEIQTEYAFNLLSSYGYIFLPGNLSALENSYLPDEDRDIILETVKWLRDVPRSPGQYLLERTLSDIWNTIVFDGTPAQVAIDIKAIDIQREFRRKMTEFGFADAEGNLLKPYTVRELDWIEEQIATHNNRTLREVRR